MSPQQVFAAIIVATDGATGVLPVSPKAFARLGLRLLAVNESKAIAALRSSTGE